MDLLREEYGLEPAGVLGHSMGEVAAGYAAGCLTREQAAAVAHAMGRLAPARGAAGGLMASVGLGAAEAAARLAGAGLAGCVVGCDNSPANATLSGAAREAGFRGSALRAFARVAHAPRQQWPYWQPGAAAQTCTPASPVRCLLRCGLQCRGLGTERGGVMTWQPNGCVLSSHLPGRPDCGVSAAPGGDHSLFVCKLPHV